MMNSYVFVQKKNCTYCNRIHRPNK